MPTRTPALTSKAWLQQLKEKYPASTEVGIYSRLEAAARVDAIKGATFELLSLILNSASNRGLHDMAKAATLEIERLNKEEAEAEIPPVGANFKHRLAANSLLELVHSEIANRHG